MSISTRCERSVSVCACARKTFPSMETVTLALTGWTGASLSVSRSEAVPASMSGVTCALSRYGLPAASR